MKSRRDDVLAALPGSLSQVVARSGVGIATASRWLTKLHADRKIRILRFGNRPPKGGPPPAIYTRGAGVDAECTSEPYGDAVRSARYRKRIRDEGEWEHHKARYRARWAADRAGFQQDPLLASLFAHKRPIDSSGMNEG